ncbi:MAG: putative rane protein [Herbinix sp.]|nr:putative rane protein [Herbinix sp.]
MKRSKNLAAAITLLTIALTINTIGCSGAKEEPIVTIDDKSIYMEDILYDVYLIEKDGNQLESYYQTHFGCSYWDYTYQGITLRESAKNSILAEVVMYELLSDQADKHGIKLSAKELDKVAATIQSIRADSSKEGLDQIGLTQNVLEKSIKIHELGDKYRDYLLKDIFIDDKSIRKSIDFEDNREYVTECLFLPTVLYEDNTISPLSEGERASANKLIKRIHNQLLAGAGFDDLLNQYSSLQYKNRNFVYGDKDIEVEYQNAAIELEKDAYSSLVTTDYGYFIIHMIDNNSSNRYEQAVGDAIATEEDKQFTALYNKIKDSYDITINFDYWDTITIGSITVQN